jgi:predicted PurR-regulated permease PerM
VQQNWGIATRIIALGFLFAGAVWLLRNIAWVISLLIVSMLIVYTLYPLLLYLKQRWKLPHGAAVGVVFLAFLLICLLGLSLLIPVIYFELMDIADDFPFYVLKLQEYLEWLTAQLLHFELEQEFRSYLVNLAQSLNQALEYVMEATLALVLGAVDLFFVLFLVFFLLYDFQAIREQFVGLFPPPKRELARRIVALIDQNTGSFIRASLIRCVIVGVVTGVTLTALGMPYSLLLGILAGLFNFVLYIGPYIAAVPALLLSFSPETPAPWVVLIVYVIIQVLDGSLLAPLLLGRVVNLKPVTIIIAILIGGKLGGVLGMVVAVPVAGMIKGTLALIQEGPLYQARPPE